MTKACDPHIASAWRETAGVTDNVATMDMHDRRILLGVTGGIAAYKSAELVRRLVERGAQVQVVMTKSAREFIGAATFQALSGRPVRDSLWDPAAEAAMGHIELARWAELVLVAPASADFMARLAHGLADDLLATLCLATTAPVVLAPAMNQQMWANAATQANARLLRERGVALLGPASGEQACGENGPGRMLEPAALAQAAAGMLADAGAARIFNGKRVLITAGPTREAIDPVRFVSNRSSGKMGYAVAEAMRAAGAEVVLVSGPVGLEPPHGVRVVAVETAAQMLEAVQREVPGTDVLVATAAVADYRPASVAERKIKKQAQGGDIALAMTPTVDILATVAARPRPPYCVGFAAESQDVERLAEEKRKRKKLPLIVANRAQDALGRDDNEVTLLDDAGAQRLPGMDKLALARRIVVEVARRLPTR